MPRIKRWFPVSHDINSDPEVIELTDQFGLSGLKVWLEILSIADRNEGIFGTDWDTIKRSLSIKCNTTQRQVSGILELTQRHLWISSELPARTHNHWKYHRSEERKPVPTRPNQTEPNLKKHRNVSNKRDRSTPFPEDFEVMPELREWAERKGYRSPDLLLESFRDHHTSKGGRFVDWTAAFRNWIRLDTEKYGNARRQSEGQLSERTMRILRRGL